MKRSTDGPANLPMIATCLISRIVQVRGSPMSEERSRREPTVGDIERPMYESLPHRRSHSDQGTQWTLGAIITLWVMIAIGAIAGWHNYARLQIEKAVQTYADEYLAKTISRATATVEINPLSNFALIHVMTPPHSYEERFVGKVVDAVVEEVRTEIEPRLDRDLELAARKFFDLYAMALPYRVSIVVEAAADPNRGWTREYMSKIADECTESMVSRERNRFVQEAAYQGEAQTFPRVKAHNSASRICTCMVNEAYKQFTAGEFDEVSGNEQRLNRFMEDLYARNTCGIADSIEDLRQIHQ